MTDLTHPERVAAAVPEGFRVVALLHDAVEDGHVGLAAARLSLHHDDGDALELLTRFPEETYARYIDLIVNGPGEAGRIARIVKAADLRDNLNRPTGPPPESLRRRYEKALAALEAVGD